MGHFTGLFQSWRVLDILILLKLNVSHFVWPCRIASVSWFDAKLKANRFYSMYCIMNQSETNVLVIYFGETYSFVFFGSWLFLWHRSASFNYILYGKSPETSYNRICLHFVFCFPTKKPRSRSLLSFKPRPVRKLVSAPHTTTRVKFPRLCVPM